jgi:hypothetical protein
MKPPSVIKKPRNRHREGGFAPTLARHRFSGSTAPPTTDARSIPDSGESEMDLDSLLDRASYPKAA